MDNVLLFVLTIPMYVLMSVVIQPSWLPNPVNVNIMTVKIELLLMLLCLDSLPLD